MSIEIPLEQALTVEQAIAAANAAKIGAQQALASIPAVIDAEVGPASAPYIAQSEDARDAALVAQGAAEAARDNALATERRMRQQSLGAFANDAAAVAWAAGQSPAITIVTGTSYLNSTSDIFRYAIVTAGPTITWHDVTEDEAAQVVLATASATAAANALSDFQSRYIGAFNSTPTYVGDTAPWSVGALYWDRLQGKFYVWSGSAWGETDATTVAAANDAAAAANSAIQVLAGSGSEDYTVNGICAFQHGAVLSFPKGLAVIGGNLVATSSFITPSTAAKTVFNPDGTARRTATNELAQSWKDGTRFGYLEANGATNLTPSPEDVSTNWTPERTTASVASNALYGIFALTTLTSLGAINDNRPFGSSTFSGDRSITFSVALLAENGGNASLGIYDTATLSYGSNATVTARVKRGPGAVAVQAGGLVNTSGLSATVPTEVEIVRTFTGSAPTTAYSMFYANWSAAGQIIKIGMPQHEDNVKVSSSYVPNGTPRAPDVWQLASGLAAQQLGQNATFIIRATLLKGYTAEDWIYQLLGDDLYSMLYVDNANFSANMWDSYSTGNLPVYFPTSTPVREIGVAMTTSKDGQRKICINGGPVAHDNKSQYSNSATTLTLGGGSVAHRSDMEIKEIVSMAAYVDNDDALRVHARPYA